MSPTRTARLVLAFLAFAAPSTLDVARGESAANVEAAEPIKGPHGGRLLQDGDLGIEVTIFERGVPPEYRVYVYDKGKPADPSTVNLEIELKRILGKVDLVRFTKKDDYLLGDQEIVEPHSFDVKVTAERGGKRSTWDYDSYEGRTVISADAALAAGIVIERAGPAEIKVRLPVLGKIVQDEEETARVSARYPGVATAVVAKLGAKVRKGERLAVIESNASLSSYELTAPIAGTITKKAISVGAFVSEKDALFEISNLDRVMAEFHVERHDFARLAVGQPIELAGSGDAKLSCAIDYLAPVGSSETQSIAVRARLPKSTPGMAPGFFVDGAVQVETVQAKVAVRKAALQTFRDWTVVFVQDGDKYEIRPLELGRDDGEFVEVLSGIDPGMTYVADKSFVVKADVGKNGATHDH